MKSIDDLRFLPFRVVDDSTAANEVPCIFFEHSRSAKAFCFVVANRDFDPLFAEFTGERDSIPHPFCDIGTAENCEHHVYVIGLKAADKQIGCIKNVQS